MSTVGDVARFKADTEQIKQEIARAEGALDNILQRLRDDFDLKDLHAAEAFLKKLKREKDEIGESHERALADYLEKWGHLHK